MLDQFPRFLHIPPTAHMAQSHFKGGQIIATLR
jgi:hypothetical protein